MRHGRVPGCGRLRVRDELPLLALPCGNRVGLQGVAGIQREKLELTAGGDALLLFGDEEANHTRCGTCGSLLYSVVRGGSYVHIALGSLADAPTIRPTAHIFVGSKAPWFEITDDLPQFAELP